MATVYLPSTRCSQGVTDRHARVQSFPQRRMSHTDYASPFRKRFYFAVVLKHSIIAFVVRLFGVCCPSTIIWFVISIVVNSINGMTAGRPWPHVLKKCLDAVDPPLANHNAPASILGISAISWIVAPLLYSKPNSIFLSFGQSMLCSTLLAGFIAETAATLSFSRCKLIGRYRCVSSTVAPAVPIHFDCGFLAPMSNSQPSKFTPKQI